jgi:uncharacterized protein
MLRVEVAYARSDVQLIVELQIEEGTTVEQAICRSGMLRKFPEIDLSVNTVGIFGRTAELGQSLRDGDRVEIYRPLKADPKQIRRRRAGAE